MYFESSPDAHVANKGYREKSIKRERNENDLITLLIHVS